MYSLQFLQIPAGADPLETARKMMQPFRNMAGSASKRRNHLRYHRCFAGVLSVSVRAFSGGSHACRDVRNLIESHYNDELAHMNLTIEFEQESDGRWIAEVAEIPGAMVYGNTKEEASAKVQALALRVLAERLEHQEASSDLATISFNAA